jgi:hypothetical protein
MGLTWVRVLFAVTGAYDLGLGLAFLFFGRRIFEATDTPPPNHDGYVQFGALLLAIFGVMFFAVAADPRGNRNLIPYGVMLKANYVGVVGFYWATGGVPAMFRPFAVIDAVMLALFVAAYLALRERHA